MNVASLELCKELYRASNGKWDKGVSHIWCAYSSDGGVTTEYQLEHKERYSSYDYPAYDLGYLLRKLPNYLEYWNGGNESGYFQLWHYSKHWSCGYSDEAKNDEALMVHLIETPEDAACKLAIELFKKGVLTK